MTEHGELLSKELKRLCHYGKGGNKGFDSIVTRLQMQSYLVIADFEYVREPEESGRRIMEYLSKLLPHASEKQLAKLLGTS